MDPQWVTKIVDLSFWGWFKAYVDVIEWEIDVIWVPEEIVEDTTAKDTHDNTELILKTLAQFQRQIIGIANDQEKLIKLVTKSKWTAKN